MFNVIIFIIAAIVISFGIIYLQINLSKKQNKRLGLILPIVSFCISLLMSFSIIWLTPATASTTPCETEKVTTVCGPAEPTEVIVLTSTSTIYKQAFFVFVLFNIPTGLLYVIHRKYGDQTVTSEEN